MASTIVYDSCVISQTKVCGQCVHFDANTSSCKRRTATEWVDGAALTLRLKRTADQSAVGCGVFHEVCPF